jgi:hypothetical protein
MMRFPDYNEIVHYARGSVVRLHVDRPSKPLSEVIVTGRAVLADRQHQAAEPSGSLVERWPEGVLTSVIELLMTKVEVTTPGVPSSEGSPRH